jgi:adenine-specific DNA-methyltransferase
MPDNDNQVQQPQKLDLRSMNIAEQRQQELLRLFPEARTDSGMLDFDRLKLALGDRVDAGRERYGMNWPGKADCFKTIQTPSMATLRPCPEESVMWDKTDNMIIEGDNLEVLKLLQKSYLGKVKMIYIDPPYNTGSDFIYPDNFAESLQTYLEYTGQVDVEGRRFGTNADTDGRYHSRWINMLYPRLYLARNLLRDDGVIFISIDDHEVDNLKRLCAEVFGEENFVAQVTTVSNPRGRQSDTFLATVHEYVLIWAKNFDECDLAGMALSEDQKAEFALTDDSGRKYRLLGLRQRGAASRREDRPDMYFPIYVNPKTLQISPDKSADFSAEVLPRKSTGEDGRWGWGRERVRRDTSQLVARMIERRGEFDIFVRDYLEKGGEERERKLKTVWDDKAFNTQNGTQEVKALLDSDAMPYPKPLGLLKTIVTTGITQPDEIVLDFFAGSGTTAHATLELNGQDSLRRHFILVQLPEPTGRSDYATISEITKERVRRVITKLDKKDDGSLAKATSEVPDRGFRVFKLDQSNLRTWDAAGAKDGKALEDQMFNHVEHIRQGRTESDLLFEILLKSGFPLATPIETLTLAGKKVFSVASGALMLCLEQPLTLEVMRAIAEKKPERVVCLDAGFANNDQLKTNAVQIFKTKGVGSFKTV